MKRALKDAANAAFRWGQRRLAAGHGAVLMFHSVPDDQTLEQRIIPAPTLEMSTADLIRHIEDHQAQGCEFISMDELAQRLQHRRLPADKRRFACATFDDGYLDNLTQALPIFKARQIPLTIFLIPGFIDQDLVHYGATLQRWVRDNTILKYRLGGQDHSLPAHTAEQKVTSLQHLQKTLGAALSAKDYRPFFEDNQIPIPTLALNWDQVRQMAQEPLVTFGAHTLNHPRLTRLDATTAQHEILGSKQRLEAFLGKPVDHFAYPFGDHGPREAALARQVGFKTISTTRQAYTNLRTTDPLALPRLRASAFKRS